MRRPMMIASAVLALTVASAASAEIFRCDSDGKVMYTDRPCASANEPLYTRSPNVMASPSRSERDLARQYDQRLDRERKARDAAYAQEDREHDLMLAKEERVRSGVVEGKIVRGMTPQQVEEVLGRATEKSHSVKKDGTDQEHWTYRDGDVTQVVTFTRGEVTGYTKRTKPAKGAGRKKKAQ